MHNAPLELFFKHLADAQLGLLRLQVPLDCGNSEPQGFRGSALAARLKGELVAELCAMPGARFTGRAGSSDEPGLVGLLWQVCGRSHVTQGGRRSLLEAGDWTVFEPGAEHLIEAGERARLLLMWTSASRIDGACPGWRRLAAQRLDCSGPAQVARAALTALLRSDTVLSAQSATTLHDALQGLVCRALTALAPAAPERSVELPLLLNHVRENLGHKALSVEQLAEAFGISRRTVYKLFEPLRVTPHQHIQNARLDQALQLLGDAAWRGVPIAGIARQCGFADPAHFSKAVRARTGRAPSALREAGVPA